MARSPFDDVVPIGSRDVEATPQPRQLASLSIGERDIRTRIHHAQRVGMDPAASSGADGEGKSLKKERGKIRLHRVVSVAEAKSMTSHLMRLFYRDAIKSPKGSERKHYAVGYGVLTDKLNALEGRPTQILGITDDVRPAAHDLAAKLATVRRA